VLPFDEITAVVERTDEWAAFLLFEENFGKALQNLYEAYTN
jgi:hypothetical protein